MITTKTIITTRRKQLLMDTETPVSLYLKLRDHFTDPVLLEGNDFRNKQESRSFIGLQSQARFKVQNKRMTIEWPDGRKEQQQVTDAQMTANRLWDFLNAFQPVYGEGVPEMNGLFGHVGFDGVQYFETIQLDAGKRKFDLPDIHFVFPRYVLAINPFKDELTILENILPGQTSQLDQLELLMKGPRVPQHPFRLLGQEQSNLTDEQFKQLVTKGKHHCQIGDVFQIVFSRQFSQPFQGDEFNVYRILRSINPSPFLFYFDFGSYKIFGSSPEAQMVIKNGVAQVNPIAGTYRRSGDIEEDAKNAQALLKDPKENAEHIMLVDLARNDLGRHAINVRVKDLKEIHYYSHVIHLVSKVLGDLPPGANPIQIFADTFPAGTLSGAPKFKAMELIDRYENQNRGFYGGSIGYLDFGGEINQAIVIRSFLSHKSTLYCQAGAGIVVSSQEEMELQEVNNKLGALKKALQEAENIFAKG